MPTIMVVCPTRGRPQKARETYDAFTKTKRDPHTQMRFIIDHDDPDFDAYLSSGVPYATFEHEGGGMGPPMNAAAAEYAKTYDIIGFVGDDHRFRSVGWDEQIGWMLTDGDGHGGIGIAYGNDLARHDIPTQVFIRSEIVRALGWFCLPGAKHLYLDNTWADLGNKGECIAYMPNVIIEHAHAFFGKSEMDAGYARVNHPSMYEHDARVYRDWNESGQAAEDIATVRRLMHGADEA